MYFLYSLAYSLVFLLMVPAFLVNRQKYATGFHERLGNYPEFPDDSRKVIWLHCVSVGEINAARPLVEKLRETFPDHRLVVSTTTRTGQELAKTIFTDKAATVVYFPFDWKFSVRRAMEHFKPSLVLLMETEIWPRFIREAKLSEAKIAIVNGRLSENSFRRYSKVRSFISRVLSDVDLALMQGDQDAKRLVSLGLQQDRSNITGNMKFDLESNADDEVVASSIRARFSLSDQRPLMIAASTHEPEEKWLLEAYCSIAAEEKSPRPRLMIAPRHPERFDAVANLMRDYRNEPAYKSTRYEFTRRSAEPSEVDKDADVVLLDSIGELRALHRLAEIVFVGGSLIDRGGQSVLEPAAAGKTIVTGPFVHNFDEVVRMFKANNALIQLREMDQARIVDELSLTLSDLLENKERRRELGGNAVAVMQANRGATKRTINCLRALLRSN